MKPIRRPLSLIVFVLILLIGAVAVSASRTIHSSAATSPAAVECADDCKDKMDKMLEKCEQLPDASRSRCRTIANEHYDKCVERCRTP